MRFSSLFGISSMAEHYIRQLKQVGAYSSVEFLFVALKVDKTSRRNMQRLLGHQRTWWLEEERVRSFAGRFVFCLRTATTWATTITIMNHWPIICRRDG